MKKLSDYTGEEAIELWADLVELFEPIFTDQTVAEVTRSGSNKIVIAKQILKSHSKEVKEILLRIDPTPINGLNIVTRLIGLLAELGESDEVAAFFGFAEQVKTENGSSGLHMVSTEGEEK